LLHVFLLSFQNFIYSSDIKGKVTDAVTGEVLAGSTIYIKELNAGTISGLDGSYSIRNIPPGNYSVNCSFIGYLTLENELTIIEDENQSLNFNLQLQTNELDKAMITAQFQSSSY
jgi:hypothetical protein